MGTEGQSLSESREAGRVEGLGARSIWEYEVWILDLTE